MGWLILDDFKTTAVITKYFLIRFPSWLFMLKIKTWMSWSSRWTCGGKHLTTFLGFSYICMCNLFWKISITFFLVSTYKDTEHKPFILIKWSTNFWGVYASAAQKAVSLELDTDHIFQFARWKDLSKLQARDWPCCKNTRVERFSATLQLHTCLPNH
jgi:hypothetical protein